LDSQKSSDTFWNRQPDKSSRVAELKDEIPIDEVLADYGYDVEFGWTSSGRYISVACPYHDDSNASASIDTEANRLHCFACDQSWDVIDVVMQEEGVEFNEAIQMLEEGYLA
jgi:DNA primase